MNETHYFLRLIFQCCLFSLRTLEASDENTWAVVHNLMRSNGQKVIPKSGLKFF